MVGHHLTLGGKEPEGLEQRGDDQEELVLGLNLPRTSSLSNSKSEQSGKNTKLFRELFSHHHTWSPNNNKSTHIHIFLCLQHLTWLLLHHRFCNPCGNSICSERGNCNIVSYPSGQEHHCSFSTGNRFYNIPDSTKGGSCVVSWSHLFLLGWSHMTSCLCLSRNLLGLNVHGSSQLSGLWFVE